MAEEPTKATAVPLAPVSSAGTMKNQKTYWQAHHPDLVIDLHAAPAGPRGHRDPGELRLARIDKSGVAVVGKLHRLVTLARHHYADRAWRTHFLYSDGQEGHIGGVRDRGHLLARPQCDQPPNHPEGDQAEQPHDHCARDPADGQGRRGSMIVSGLNRSRTVAGQPK